MGTWYSGTMGRGWTLVGGIMRDKDFIEAEMDSEGCLGGVGAEGEVLLTPGFPGRIGIGCRCFIITTNGSQRESTLAFVRFSAKLV